MINMPPYLCEVCGLHKRIKAGHAKCSKILQEKRTEKKSKQRSK